MVHTKSPRITHLSWGNVEIEIDGRRQRFKDAKLFPGAREWDWRETDQSCAGHPASGTLSSCLNTVLR